MAYIGTDINYGNIASQTGTGDGTTTPIATLDYSVPTSASIIVTLDGVTQVPTTDYTASGTTLTFTSSVASPIAILVVFLGRSLDIGTPADGTVTNAKVDGSAAIATSKLSGAVTSIPSHGLGALASLATVGTTQIDNDSVTGAKLNPALVAGDIIYADGTDTINRLAKPATPAGEVLTFATSATAPSWVAPAGGGKVLQCVYASKLDEFVGTNTSWTDVTGMTVTTGAIASTSSRVLVTCALYIYDYTANSFLKITDGSGGDITGFIGAVAGASQIRASSGSIYQDHPNVGRHVSLQLMDTTASTSARTYKLQFIAASGGTVRMNRTSTDTNSNSYGRSVSSIMATEIGA